MTMYDHTRTSIHLRILDLTLQLTAPARTLEQLRLMLPDPPAWTAQMPARASADIELIVDNPSGCQYILVDGSMLWCDTDAVVAAPILEWAIARTAIIALAPRYLLFHAGAVVRHGLGVILPAASGRGKTTLVAALLAAGWDYCSDEIAAIDRTTLNLYPFPKQLCLKAGSCAPLASRFPCLLGDEAFPRFAQHTVRFLKPPRWSSAPTPVSFVLFPHYIPGVSTQIVPLRRPEALPQLIDVWCKSEQQVSRDLPLLVNLLQRSTSYILVRDDLHEAIECLHDLIH